jgi:heme-degrading monooxygenase HmoA
MSDGFWTIHVWTATSGRELELADAWERMVSAHHDGSATLYRVSDDPRVHYTPMRWDSREAYELWRGGPARDAVDAVEAACDDVKVVPLDVVRVMRP